MLTYQNAVLQPATWITQAKAAFDLGSNSQGYFRLQSIPKTVAEFPLERGLSAKLSFATRTASAAKLAQYRAAVGRPLYDANGVPCGFEGWIIGGGRVTSDGLSIAAGADTLYSPVRYAPNGQMIGPSPAARLGGTLTWTASSAAASGTNPTVPPGPLTSAEALYNEGTSDVVTNAGGLGFLFLPCLLRSCLLWVDLLCRDDTGATTNAVDEVAAVLEVSAL